MNKAGFMFSESILVSDWNERRSSWGFLCTRHGANALWAHHPYCNLWRRVFWPLIWLRKVTGLAREWQMWVWPHLCQPSKVKCLLSTQTVSDTCRMWCYPTGANKVLWKHAAFMFPVTSFPSQGLLSVLPLDLGSTHSGRQASQGSLPTSHPCISQILFFTFFIGMSAHL